MSGLSRIVGLSGCVMLLAAAISPAQVQPPMSPEEIRRAEEKAQLEKLAGKWDVVGLRCEGKTTQPKNYEVVVQKEKVGDREVYFLSILKDKKEERKFRIAMLDPRQIPAWLDLDTVSGDYRGTQVYGVYEMSDRSLFIGLPLEPNTAQSRVRDISGGVGSGSLRLELSRPGDMVPPK